MSARSLALTLTLLLGVGLALRVLQPTEAEAGSTRVGQACSDDDDCSPGHSCYEDDQGNQKCVACSVSDLKYYTSEVERWCKSSPVSCQKNLPQTPEIPRALLQSRLEQTQGCIAARQRREDRCWAGGDATHRQEIADYTQVANECKRDLAEKGGMALLYTCSESTYASLSATVARTCGALSDCKAWRLDRTPVDCEEIERRIDKVEQCQDSMDRLASSCLDGRRSTSRQSAYASMDDKVETCEELLAYKKRAGLCQ